MVGFHIFHHHSEAMDSAKNEADGKRYFSGTAQHWIENIAIEVCGKEELVLADELLYNYALYGKNYTYDWDWFPLTYIYDGEHGTSIQKLAESFKSNEIAQVWTNIFGYDEIAEFKRKVAEVGDNRARQTGYSQAFYKAPMIGGYIAAEEIGVLL